MRAESRVNKVMLLTIKMRGHRAAAEWMAFRSNPGSGVRSNYNFPKGGSTLFERSESLNRL